MQERTKRKKIGDALMKVALGCRVEEVTEEYAEVDGELRLTKRRETKKDIPPDLKAVQLLMASPEEGASDCSALSDEQLEAEKRRLLGLLQGAEEGVEKGNKGAGLRRKAIPEGTDGTEEGGIKTETSARSAASKKSAGAAKSAGRTAKAGAGGESGTEAKPRRRAAKRRRRTKQ